MTSHRITDQHVAALLDGCVPEDREDLQHVADVLGTLRLAAFEAPPQPSAALAARLDLDRLAWVSPTRGTGVPACDVDRTPVRTQRSAKPRAKRALGWFTGLGIAAQLALGAGAVSASAAGIGMAGALPPAAQQMFDTVVATVARAELLPGSIASGSEDAREEVAADARTGVDGTDTDVPAESGADTGGAAAPSDAGAEPGLEDGTDPGVGLGIGDPGAHAPGNDTNRPQSGHPGNGNGNGRGNSGAGSDTSSKRDTGAQAGDADRDRPVESEARRKNGDGHGQPTNGGPASADSKNSEAGGASASLSGEQSGSMPGTVTPEREPGSGGAEKTPEKTSRNP